MALFKVKVTKKESGEEVEYRLYEWNPSMFQTNATLKLITSDYQSVKTDFNNIEKLDIYAGENFLAAFTAYDSFSSAMAFSSQFYEPESRFVDVIEINLTNLVDVIGVSGSRYKIKIANAYIGYIDKAKITTPDKLTKSEYPYVGKCTGNDVAVRKDAGTSYAKISGYPTLNKDNKVDVLGVKKDSFGNKWKQVKIANKYIGYVFGKYITRV